MTEPDGAPRNTEEKTWNLPIGVRSPYTSLDPDVADRAWANIVIGTERKMSRCSLPRCIVIVILTALCAHRRGLDQDSEEQGRPDWSAIGRIR